MMETNKELVKILKENILKIELDAITSTKKVTKKETVDEILEMIESEVKDNEN